MRLDVAQKEVGAVPIKQLQSRGGVIFFHERQFKFYYHNTFIFLFNIKTSQVMK